jgi:hypothetical protein
VEPRRAYGTALALLGAGGLGLLVAYGLTWATADVPLLAGADGAVRAHALTGRDLFPAAAMSGWVALAGLAGVVATRSWGRRLVALLTLLAGLAGAGAAVAFAVAPTGIVDAAVATVAGGSPGAAFAVGPGWLLAVVAGAVVVVASAWTVVRGRAWPSLGRRYERGTRGGREISAWEAQDLGQDPTDDLVE